MRENLKHFFRRRGNQAKTAVAVLAAWLGAVAFADENSAETDASDNAVEQPKSEKSEKTKRPAKITSRSTYYDRKEGIGVFSGDVYVDDEDYQMHADKVYLFMKGTNELERIVAVGNVALTNDMRRAYGAKVSYYKEGGMVVLYSGDGIVAEVRDESKEQDQVVRGRKIKFWIDTEQVEILEAEISAPTGGMGKGGLKSGFNKIIGK
jgi:lipopolysaccharide transport protein LptA